MLNPENVGVSGALGDAMWILLVHIAAKVGGDVLRKHSLSARVPALSSVAGPPHAADRDAQRDALGVTGIDADGVDSGVVIAPTRPAAPISAIPERLHELPRLAPVG